MPPTTRPRIRSLKPEHRLHRKVGRLSDHAYRLWIGMILEADDEGRLVCDPEHLAAVIFGYSSTNDRRVLVESSLMVLDGLELLFFYVIDGVEYAYFPSWHDHQKIDRPSPSKLPAYESSSRIRRILVEDSSTPRAGSDRIGSDLTPPNPPARGGAAQTAKATTNGHTPHPPRSRAEALAEMKAKAVELLDWLNAQAKADFRAFESDGRATKNLELIIARLKSGIQPFQLRLMISRQIEQWKDDPEMEKFLRPATLFNRTKCEQYIGMLKTTPAPDPYAKFPR